MIQIRWGKVVTAELNVKQEARGTGTVLPSYNCQQKKGLLKELFTIFFITFKSNFCLTIFPRRETLVLLPFLQSQTLNTKTHLIAAIFI